MEALNALTQEVDKWVSKYICSYKPRPISSNKVIKDPVWGMTGLTPLEISILDSPLLQRLRRIHQTGLVYLTYPAALHTRFDHSIGMLHCATLIIDSINRKYKSSGKSIPFSDIEEQEIRLASLLHDIGHTALSHLTEGIFSNYSTIIRAKKELEERKGIRPKNHEFLSAVIVRTSSFLCMLDEAINVNHPPFIKDVASTVNHISDMIIGLPIDDKNDKAYITDIVNGPYDADRLDYTFRDSYFTGISLGTDAEKFIAGLSIEKVEIENTKKRRREIRDSIVLDANSVSSYDQLILSKVSLYSTVYNHQKVLATNQIIENIMKILIRDPKNHFIKNVNLENPIDFLSLSDWDFLTGNTDSIDIEKLQKNIERRNLPVRYVILSRLSIENKDKKFPPDIIPYCEDPNKRENLRELICHDLGTPESGPDTITVGFPQFPQLNELGDAYCKNYDGSIEPFNNLSPMNYFRNYSMYKWAGYIFGPYESLDEKRYDKICSILDDQLKIKLSSNAKPKIFLKGDTAWQ